MKRDVSVLLLYNDKGEILLQRRSGTAKRYPGVWGFFGGGVESGETPESAMHREIQEELNYVSKDAALVLSYEFTNYMGESGMKYIFVEKYDGSPLTQQEGEALGWFLPEDTGALETIPHDGKALAAAAAYIREHL